MNDSSSPKEASALEKSPIVTRDTAKLLYISQCRADENWHSIPHTHNCTELFYCTKGLGRFRISEHFLDIHAGDLIIIDPQLEHTEMSLGQPMGSIVLGLGDVEFEFSPPEPRFRLLHFSEPERLEYLLTELLDEHDHIEERKPTGIDATHDLLDLLLIRLLRAEKMTLRSYLSTQISGNRECALIKRYMDENFCQSLTLDQLSDVAHINKFYLAHSFQKEYGVSPITYLIKRRIAESKYLLSNTNYTLSEISGLTGFSSLSYFSQSFRKTEGLSPNEYRKKVLCGALVGEAKRPIS